MSDQPQPARPGSEARRVRQRRALLASIAKDARQGRTDFWPRKPHWPRNHD